MGVHRVMLLNAFDAPAEIEADTPEIMHSEPLLNLVLDLPNQALFSNHQEIIDVQNARGKRSLLCLLRSTNSPPSTSDASNPIEIKTSLKVLYQPCEDCFWP
jgi:hypothetical protein